MSSPTAPDRRAASSGPVTHLVDVDRLATLDILGVAIRYLTEPDPNDDLPCLMRGEIPPGVIVPLHAHPDPETFLQLSGEMDGLSMSDDGFEWLRVRPGDVFHIPGGARHALRNPSRAPSVAVLATTSRMGRFFREIGTPAGAGTRPPGPPSEATIRHFLATSARYGYWNASPEENAAIGLAV